MGPHLAGWVMQGADKGSSARSAPAPQSAATETPVCLRVVVAHLRTQPDLPLGLLLAGCAAVLAAEKEGGRELKQLVHLAGGSVVTAGKAKKPGAGGRRLQVVFPGGANAGDSCVC